MSIVSFINLFSSRAPAGCLQYFDTISGKFTTFNYLETTTKAHLSNQQ